MHFFPIKICHRDISTLWSSDFPRKPTQLPSFLFAQREHETLRGKFHSPCHSFVLISLFLWLLSSTVWNWYIQLQLSCVGASPVGLCLYKNIESELRYGETSDNPNNEEPQHTNQLSTLSEVWLGVRVKGRANRGKRGNQLFFSLQLWKKYYLRVKNN